jgi:hypothetical protein
MIISRITGGLGNQLFIYAASRRLALKNNIDLVLDNISGFTYDKFKRNYELGNFNIPCRVATATERLEPLSIVRRYFKRLINKKIPINKRSYIFEEGKDFETQLLNLHPKGNIYLEGSFLSENFFKDTEKKIRGDLVFKCPKDSKNLLMLEKIKNATSIAVHVRFPDDKSILFKTNSENIFNISNNFYKSFYKRAILEINKIVHNPHYFIFSNKPKKVFHVLPFDKGKMTIVDHQCNDNVSYSDLWLMSNCQHFVIPHSTFSWWGAWLSSYNSKIVIVPKIDNSQNIFFINKIPISKGWKEI